MTKPISLEHILNNLKKIKQINKIFENLEYIQCPICKGELILSIYPKLTTGEGFFIIKECLECGMNWGPSDKEEKMIFDLYPEDELAQFELIMMDWYKEHPNVITESEKEYMKGQFQKDVGNKLGKIIKQKMKGKKFKNIKKEDFEFKDITNEFNMK